MPLNLRWLLPWLRAAYFMVARSVSSNKLQIRTFATFCIENFLLVSVVIGSLCLLVLAPLSLVFWFSLTRVEAGASVFTLANYLRTFSDPETYRLLHNTTVFTFSSVSIGTVVGIGVAWLLERTNSPLRSLGLFTMVLSVSLPSLLFGIAWVLALNPRTGVLNLPFLSLGWEQGPFNPRNIDTMIWLQAVRSTGTVFFIVSGLFRSMDAALEHAAAISGANSWTTARRVTLPLLLPGILCAVIYITTATMGAFDIPAVVGIPANVHVLATQIYLAQAAVPPDYGYATSLASPTGFVGVIAILLYHQVTSVQSRYATITGKGSPSGRISLSRLGRVIGGVFVSVLFVLFVALPVAILGWASLLPFYQAPSFGALTFLSLDAYRDLFIGPASINFMLGFRNTMILAIVVPIVTVLLAASVSWLVIKRRIVLRSWVDGLAFLPHTVPLVVFGLAWVIIGTRVNFIPLYGTIWIIVFAQIGAFLPFASRATNGAILLIHKDLEDAATMSGASVACAFRRILLPLLAVPLVTTGLWVGVHVAGDFTLSVLLSSPDSETLSIFIWTSYLNGNLDRAAAAAMVLLLFISLLLFAGRVLARFVYRG